MTGFAQDLRFGLRSLVGAPVHALAALLVLALGTGAATSLFSVVDAVLLRPLPHPAPGALVVVQQAKGQELGGVSAPALEDWRAGTRDVFTGLAAWGARSYVAAGEGGPVRVEALVASAALLPLLGTPPALGRLHRPEEDLPGAARTVVLTHGYWERRLGADPRAVGRTVLLDDTPFTVVGVLPPRFAFPLARAAPDLVVTVAVDADPALYGGSIPRSRGYMRYDGALARLRPGVAVAQAQAAMDAVAEGVARAHPGATQYVQARVTPALERVAGAARPTLALLLAAVGCLLLIGCTNVANLQLVRTRARRHELALRLALGASRWRVARQLLTEALLLAWAGGALGALLAAWGVDALVALAPPGVPRLGEARVDGAALAACLGVSTLAALLSGLAPALAGAHADLQGDLRGGARASAAGRRVRAGLVAAQTGVALVLLVAAGLVVHGTLALQGVDPGFEPRGLLTFRLELPVSRYPQGSERVAQAWEALTARLRALPGVTAVGAAQALPLSGGDNGTSVALDGAPAGEAATRLRFVDAGYLRTLRVPLLEGRGVGVEDAAGAAPVALVNAAFVRRFSPDRPVLGRRVTLGWGGESPRTVVGVVGDVRHAQLGAPPEPEVYVPLEQFPLNGLALVLRAEGDPRALASAVRGEVRALDAGLPVEGLRTVEEAVREGLVDQRFVTALLVAFGACALVLALAGLAGTVAHGVAQRTHELGIRMALGAQGRDVLVLVLWQGLRAAAAGALVGVACAAALTRGLARWLHGVSPTDPWTFAAAALLLVGAALLASWLPARRAVRVSPLVALRGP